MYLEVLNSKLTLKATDYEIGFFVKTNNINIIEDGSITANGKKLLDIMAQEFKILGEYKNRKS